MNVAQYNGRGVKRGDPIGGVLHIRFHTTDADPQGVALHLCELFPTVGTLQLIIPDQFIIMEGDDSDKQPPSQQSQQQNGIMDDALYTCKLSVQAEV